MLRPRVATQVLRALRRHQGRVKQVVVIEDDEIGPVGDGVHQLVVAVVARHPGKLLASVAPRLARVGVAEVPLADPLVVALRGLDDEVGQARLVRDVAQASLAVAKEAGAAAEWPGGVVVCKVVEGHDLGRLGDFVNVRVVLALLEHRVIGVSTELPDEAVGRAEPVKLGVGEHAPHQARHDA
eukprot:2047032-Prymnesium_polylepis.1